MPCAIHRPARSLNPGRRYPITQLINATPHAITILGTDNAPIITLAPSGLVLRCATSTLAAPGLAVDESFALVPVSTTVYGQVEAQSGGDVPSVVQGVHYVVSALVRLAAPERSDFLSPGPLVRDAAGQPIGCQGLSQ